MKPSAISWCDFSGGDLNVVTGCTPVSAGCAHCYARAIYERFGRDFLQVTCHPDKLDRLVTARFPEYSPKRGAPHMSMCFVCDTGDLFHEEVPGVFIDLVLQTLCERADVTWQLLTKRAERMHDYLGEWAYLVHGPLPPHVWLGVSVEDQVTADERIPLLLDTPAAHRFVSVEPCLSAVNLRPYLPLMIKPGVYAFSYRYDHKPYVSYVICGGESGRERRPFDVAWALDLHKQCQEAGIPFFYKQGSSLRPGEDALLPGLGRVQEWA